MGGLGKRARPPSTFRLLVSDNVFLDSLASLSLSLSLVKLTSSRACRARELLLRGAPFGSEGGKTKRKRETEGYTRKRIEELNDEAKNKRSG